MRPHTGKSPLSSKMFLLGNLLGGGYLEEDGEGGTCCCPLLLEV